MAAPITEEEISFQKGYTCRLAGKDVENIYQILLDITPSFLIQFSVARFFNFGEQCATIPVLAHPKLHVRKTVRLFAENR